MSFGLDHSFYDPPMRDGTGEARPGPPRFDVSHVENLFYIPSPGLRLLQLPRMEETVPPTNAWKFPC